MQEKELIRSQPYTGKIIITILLVLGLLFSIASIFDTYTYLSDRYTNHEHRSSCYQSKHSGDPAYLTCHFSDYETATEYAIDQGMEDYIRVLIIFVGGPLLFGLLLRLMLKTFGMVITDKRIYGWSVFQLWRTDLPLEMLQSVSLIGFTGIRVRTAGGGIMLFLIKNRKDLHTVLCQQIIQKYSASQPASLTGNQSTPSNGSFQTPQPSAEEKRLERELYRLKELRENGQIGQEEYEILMNQLQNQ